MKLIIDIPEEEYKRMKDESIYSTHTMICAIQNGIMLDELKAEIENRLEEEVTKTYDEDILKYHSFGLSDGLKDARDILDNIGKAESEDKK